MKPVSSRGKRKKDSGRWNSPVSHYARELLGCTSGTPQACIEYFIRTPRRSQGFLPFLRPQYLGNLWYSLAFLGSHKELVSFVSMTSSFLFYNNRRLFSLFDFSSLTFLRPAAGSHYRYIGMAAIESIPQRAPAVWWLRITA